MIRFSGVMSRTALATIIMASLAACTTTPGAKTASMAASAETKAQGQSSLLSMADRLAATGDHAAAIPLYRSAHGSMHGDVRPLIGLGRSLAALGQFAEAEKAYRLAAGRSSENVAALTGLGQTLIQTGQPELALPFLNNALRLSPTNHDALLNKALAEDLLGNHAAALDSYAQALSSSPDDIRVLNNYGLSLTVHGDTSTGIASLEQATRAPAATAAVRKNLALAYVLTGHSNQAERLLAIDHDLGSLPDQLAQLRSVAALEPSARLAALFYGNAAPKHTTLAPANRMFDQDAAAAHTTALRIIGTGAPVIAEAPALPEPVTITPTAAPTAAPAAQADADLSDIPLLEQEGWALQLAAYRKASQLKDGWEQLKASYGDIIGHLPPRRTEINFGPEATPKGFYYRLNAGPLTDKAEADALCAKLVARGAACWVRPPDVKEGRLPKTAETVAPASHQVAEQAPEQAVTAVEPSDTAS